MLKLSQDDVTELIAELEEEKLQLRIQSQRKNLIRSSTRIDSEIIDDGNLAEPAAIDSSFQISPLDGKRLQLSPSDGPPAATLNWSNRQNLEPHTTTTRNQGATNTTSIDGNPFYNNQGQV